MQNYSVLHTSQFSCISIMPVKCESFDRLQTVCSQLVYRLGLALLSVIFAMSPQ